MQQETTKLTGVVKTIGDLERIQRKTLPDLHKKVLSFESVDGQIIFPEVRNRKLSLLDNIEEGDNVIIEVVFQGSEKNGKRYNNIYTCDIKKY